MKIINLDSVKKASNKSEFRWVPRATCGRLSVTGDGHIIRKIIALIIEEGYTGDIEVRRGDKVVFERHNIMLWHERDPLSGTAPEHLRKKEKVHE